MFLTSYSIYDVFGASCYYLRINALPSIYNLLVSLFDFIENHSTLVGVCVVVVGGLLFTRKYLREKRAEAFCSFYAQLLFHIVELRKMLERYHDLEISKSDSGEWEGNVFCLRYTEETAQEFGYSINSHPDRYKEIADSIKNLLLTSSTNVYPKKAKKNEWYKAQQIIFDFCMFVNDGKSHGVLNNVSHETKPWHIIEGEKLLGAIKYIEESIYLSKF